MARSLRNAREYRCRGERLECLPFRPSTVPSLYRPVPLPSRPSTVPSRGSLTHSPARSLVRRNVGMARCLPLFGPLNTYHNSGREPRDN